MSHGNGSMLGAFMGILHALALFFTMAVAFLVGCWLDFMKDPWSWIKDYWLPALLIFVGLVGMVRDGGRWFRGKVR